MAATSMVAAINIEGMPMYFSVIRTRVAKYLDNRTDLNTDIDGWINDVRRDVATEYEFDYLYAEATCETTAASARYAFPADFLGHEQLFIGAKKLVRIGARELDEIIGEEITLPESTSGYLFTTSGVTPGVPDYYVSRGMEFDLWPVPDDAYTLTIKYYYQPADFTQETEEDYLTRFHPELIIWGAALRGALFLDDKLKIQTYGAAYERQIKQMLEKEKRLSGADLHVRWKSFRDFSPTQFRRITKIQ